MSTSQPTRRTASCLILALCLIGAFVVLRALLKASFWALGLAFKLLAACGGLLLLALAGFLVWRLVRRPH